MSRPGGSTANRIACASVATSCGTSTSDRLRLSTTNQKPTTLRGSLPVRAQDFRLRRLPVRGGDMRTSAANRRRAYAKAMRFSRSRASS